MLVAHLPKLCCSEVSCTISPTVTRAMTEPMPITMPIKARTVLCLAAAWLLSASRTISLKGDHRAIKPRSGGHRHMRTVRRHWLAPLWGRGSPSPWLSSFPGSGPKRCPMISWLTWESRAPVGSSARISEGLPDRARAMATLCCWPPDSSGWVVGHAVAHAHPLEHLLGQRFALMARRYPPVNQGQTSHFPGQLSRGSRLNC